VKEKSPIVKPPCPSCGKPMALVSTGSMIRTFECLECQRLEIVKREDRKEARDEGMSTGKN
jgi:hypothetical protein